MKKWRFQDVYLHFFVPPFIYGNQNERCEQKIGLNFEMKELKVTNTILQILFWGYNFKDKILRENNPTKHTLLSNEIFLSFILPMLKQVIGQTSIALSINLVILNF